MRLLSSSLQILVSTPTNDNNITTNDDNITTNDDNITNTTKIYTKYID